MMERKAFCGLVTAIFLFTGICLARQAEKKTRKFQFELSGGWTEVHKLDLNHRPKYDEALEEVYLNRYMDKENQLGDWFNFSWKRDGKFKKIKGCYQINFRLKYWVNRSLAVSLGLKYTAKKQNSVVAYQYDVESMNPDDVVFYTQYTLKRSYSPYILSAKGYAPMVGLHYALGRYSNLSFESYVAGGPFFVSSLLENEITHRYEYSHGYWYRQNYVSSLKGKGIGIAFDFGIRINLKVSNRTGLFLLGGYTWQKASKISGEYLFEEKLDDLNATGNSQKYSTKGQWILVPASFDASYKFISIVSLYDQEDYECFTFSLTGVQVRVGLYFAF